jgi:hypothetical protein
LSRLTHFRPDHQRLAVANEAARIIQEEGLTDFRSAKEKALERLGLPSSRTRLPSNKEIDQALAERIRIFRGNDHLQLLTEFRRAALSVLRTLKMHHAQLVGPVLNGTATDFSTIDMHLFSDLPENIESTFDALGFGHRPTLIRHRFRRGETERFPGYRFRTLNFDYTATVFSLKHRRHSPLSPIDGKPMLRAGIQKVEALLD